MDDKPNSELNLDDDEEKAENNIDENQDDEVHDKDDKIEYIDEKAPANKIVISRNTSVYQLSTINLNTNNTEPGHKGDRNVTVQQMESGSAGVTYSSSRNQFIKKVLIIEWLMLMLTAAFVLTVYSVTSLRMTFFRYNMIFLIIGSLLIMITNYALACSECSKQALCSCYLLVVGVIGMSIITAGVTARLKTSSVVIALAATAAVVLVCVLLACTSFDFTKLWLYVIAIGVAIAVLSMGFSLFYLFTGTFVKPAYVVLSLAGTLISVVALIMQVQAIIGGKTVELEENEYALGAFMVYMSIINIFLNLAMSIDLFSD